MKFDIVNKASKLFSKQKFILKKNSPEILVFSGVLGMAGSAIMACKATTKLSGILEEHKEQAEEIRNYVEAEGYSEEYTEQDKKKDLVIVYSKTAFNIAKLYAPSVIVGGLSAVGILKGHNILQKRNIAIASAYAAIDQGFKDYRSRVVSRFGEDVDKELKYDIVSKKVSEKIIDEDGNKKKVKSTIPEINATGYSDYARFYDCTCKGWQKSPEDNLKFLKGVQAFANQKLKDEKVLFLNDVYDMLGIERTQAGQIVGWTYNEKHPNGDNYVDFGIYDVYSEANRRFVNGLEYNIILDFNVDGPVYKHIERKK